MKPLYYLALVMLALPATAFLPSAIADGVGASGQCYGEDGTSGGEDEVRVDTDSGIESGLDPVPGNHGVTDAVLELALGTAFPNAAPTACDQNDCYQSQGECAEQGHSARYDYLEVDATVAGNYVQVCYAGTIPPGTNNDCPHHPTGKDTGA